MPKRGEGIHSVRLGLGLGPEELQGQVRRRDVTGRGQLRQEDPVWFPD